MKKVETKKMNHVTFQVKLENLARQVQSKRGHHPLRFPTARRQSIRGKDSQRFIQIQNDLKRKNKYKAQEKKFACLFKNTRF